MFDRMDALGLLPANTAVTGLYSQRLEIRCSILLERSMLIRAVGVNDHGIETGVICSDRLDLGPLREAVEGLPLGVMRLPLRSRREYRLRAFRPTLDFAQRRRIRGALESIGPDVLVLGQPGPDDCHTALLAAGDMGIPVIADVALVLDPAWMPYRGGALRHWWIRRYYRLCRAIVTNCRRNAELLEWLGCGPVDSFPVIPTGIDPDKFPACPGDYERNSARKALGVSDGAWVVGTVGRMSIEKGYDWLIDAFGELRKSIPEAELVIIGGGELEPELKRRAASVGGVHFPGWRDDVPQLMWGMDAFVLSSRIEAFPRVVMQSFCAKVPTVATAVHGVPDMVTDGETGWLVSPDDTDALVAALRQTHDSPKEAIRRADAAHEHVCKELHQATQQSRFAALIREVLADKNRPPRQSNQ